MMVVNCNFEDDDEDPSSSGIFQLQEMLLLF